MRLLRSLLRILAAVALAVAGAVAFVRQPTLPARATPARQMARPATLRADVTMLTSMNRCAADPASLDRAADYLALRLAASGAIVTRQRYAARRRVYQNVVATFPGDGPPVVVGAHYDAFCEPRPLPGADDNASGVAGLLELARIVAASPHAVPVILVAYSTEEPPFFASEEMGSAMHAASLREPPRGMICLEMIGCFTDRQPAPSRVLAMLYPSHGRFVAVAGRPRDVLWLRHVKRALSGAIETVAFTGPASFGIDASDQRSYWAAGIRAVMVGDTAYIRNPRYHTAADTAETLDYERMARVVDGVANAVLTLR